MEHTWYCHPPPLLPHCCRTAAALLPHCCRTAAPLHCWSGWLPTSCRRLVLQPWCIPALALFGTGFFIMTRGGWGTAVHEAGVALTVSVLPGVQTRHGLRWLLVVQGLLGALDLGRLDGHGAGGQAHWRKKAKAPQPLSTANRPTHHSKEEQSRTYTGPAGPQQGVRVRPGAAAGGGSLPAPAARPCLRWGLA
ncbi:hypothetical protein HaLaN_24882 [Haematococcus lacustris]|uniref:Uncharacterized protein n=1 Tax=Haematococcus lacustris TaxID=44745 RepID=A0A699ZVJ3_HAELA|nr:hypothetical protein HaLaN_24882 [Haematococcus lacustris]